MPATSWIAHVKATHKKMGGTYKAAMMAAKKTWKKKGPRKRGDHVYASTCEAVIAEPGHEQMYSFNA